MPDAALRADILGLSEVLKSLRDEVKDLKDQRAGESNNSRSSVHIDAGAAGNWFSAKTAVLCCVFMTGLSIGLVAMFVIAANERAELRKALKAMRKYEEKAQKEQAKIREKEHKAWREEMARMHDDAEKSRIDFEKAEKFRLTDAQIAAIRSEAEQAARNAQSRAYASREQAAEQRREAEEYHREAEERRREAALQREDANERRLESLEAQLEALEEARDSLEEQVDGSFEDALVDLEVAEADLEFEDLSKEEMDAARSAIRDQRRRLERDSAYHKRAIETAQTRLDSQIANVEKQIEALDEADFDE